VGQQGLEFPGPAEAGDQVERGVPVSMLAVVGKAGRARGVGGNEPELPGSLGEKRSRQWVQVNLRAPLDENPDIERACRDRLGIRTQELDDELAVETGRHRQRGQSL